MINQPAHLLRGLAQDVLPGRVPALARLARGHRVGPSPWEAAADALNRLQAGEPVTPDWTMTDESPA